MPQAAAQNVHVFPGGMGDKEAPNSNRGVPNKRQGPRAKFQAACLPDAFAQVDDWKLFGACRLRLEDFIRDAA
jgi:hypothetical protein